LNIKFFQDNIQFRLTGRNKIKNLLADLISEENKIAGNINVILSDDISIIEINSEFLNHNYFTDVISFRQNEGVKIDGEIYISVDTVKRNSINYKVSFNDELMRVLIHGTLHLCGYEDRTEQERNLMRKKEDKWLFIFNSMEKNV
jgi:probable rRNA maturation factor